MVDKPFFIQSSRLIFPRFQPSWLTSLNIFQAFMVDNLFRTSMVDFVSNFGVDFFLTSLSGKVQLKLIICKGVMKLSCLTYGLLVPIPDPEPISILYYIAYTTLCIININHCIWHAYHVSPLRLMYFPIEYLN